MLYLTILIIILNSINFEISKTQYSLLLNQRFTSKILIPYIIFFVFCTYSKYLKSNITDSNSVQSITNALECPIVIKHKRANFYNKFG